MIIAQMINDAKVLAGFIKRKQGTRLQSALKAATTKCAIKVQRRMIEKILNGPKTGDIYGKHQASAPGEPPANDHGDLQRSIAIVAAQVTAYGAVAKVTASSDHAGPLEYGTKTIEPRPFFFSTFNEMQEELNEIIMEAVKDAREAEE